MNWLGRLDAEGWSAIATAGGVIVALAFGVFERWGRQNAARRAQADEVGAWLTTVHFLAKPPSVDDRLAVRLNNSSNQPVYDVTAVLVFRGGSGPQSGEDWANARYQKTEELTSVFAQLPPGQYTHWLKKPEDSLMQSGGGVFVEIAFTDQSGRHWIRRSNGRLQTLRKNAIDHYGYMRPVSYDQLSG